MPISSKPLTVTRLNDLILGSFACMPSSRILDHLVRYLGTWSGTDKLFMIIQYAVKVLAPLYHLRAKLQYRAGLRSYPTSRTAHSYLKLGNIIGDSRTLWRIWGLLPIIQWLTALERNPPPTRNLLTIERLQGWSMLIYYPLEHLSYVRSHGVIPARIPMLRSLLPPRLTSFPVNPDTLSMWSCRFWALYVFLQFAHLKEDRKLLKLREKALSKVKGNGLSASEKMEISQRRDAFWNEVVVNVGYLPLTLHWSLKNGLFSNEIWVGIFGTIAAVASFRSGWKATALPPIVTNTDDCPAPGPSASAAPDTTPTTTSYDVFS